MVGPGRQLAGRRDREYGLHPVIARPAERHQCLEQQHEVAPQRVRRQPLQPPNARRQVEPRERSREREKLDRPQSGHNDESLPRRHSGEKARHRRGRVNAVRSRPGQRSGCARHHRFRKRRQDEAVARTETAEARRIHAASVRGGLAPLQPEDARWAAGGFDPWQSPPPMRLRLSIGAAFLFAALFVPSALGASVVSIFTIAGPGSLNGPQGVAAAPDGTVYVAGTIGQPTRKLDTNGRLSTIAGNGDSDFKGDGGPATSASFQDPTALALGPDGSLYVTDTGNSRVRVIRPNGTIVTVAGVFDQGFSGDGGPAASVQVNAPQGITVDPAGRVFFSDTGNNRVRVIRPDGTIATLAGNGSRGSAGDGGPATAAQLDAPNGLALASDGSLLIADSANNRIRRVGFDGRIATVAGNGGGGSGGDGGPATSAQLNRPVDVAAAPGGVFYIAEQGGNRIRRVDSSGTISRVAGTGAPRFGGDGRVVGSSYVNAPHALEVAPSGKELLIADTDNNRVRYVTTPGQSSRLAIAPIKSSVTFPLVKKKIVVKKRKRRILVVKDLPFTWRLSEAASLRFRVATKKGRFVTTLKAHAGPGVGAYRLPARLRSGRHRLTKDHYVVSVTATAGSAFSTKKFELVVK